MTVERAPQAVLRTPGDADGQGHRRGKVGRPVLASDACGRQTGGAAFLHPANAARPFHSKAKKEKEIQTGELVQPEGDAPTFTEHLGASGRWRGPSQLRVGGRQGALVGVGDSRRACGWRLEV